jgi:hypothetical protein
VDQRSFEPEVHGHNHIFLFALIDRVPFKQMRVPGTIQRNLLGNAEDEASIVSMLGTNCGCERPIGSFCAGLVNLKSVLLVPIRIEDEMR